MAGCSGSPIHDGVCNNTGVMTFCMMSSVALSKGQGSMYFRRRREKGHWGWAAAAYRGRRAPAVCEPAAHPPEKAGRSPAPPPPCCSKPPAGMHPAPACAMI